MTPPWLRLPPLLPVRPTEPLLAVVDRLSAGGASQTRLRDSLETAFAKGESVCHVLVEESPELAAATWLPRAKPSKSTAVHGAD